jgi:hypothetical protein
MAVADERIDHLRECFNRSIGPEATSTVMVMLTSIDVSNLATKDDIRMVIDRMDVRFAAMDEKFTHRIDEMDRRWSERLDAMDERWTERLAAMDDKWELRLAAIDDKWEQRLTTIDDRWELRDTATNNKWEGAFVSLDDKFEALEQRMTAVMYRAINRHLTFSVMAMATVSGMFTWLAR